MHWRTLAVAVVVLAIGSHAANAQPIETHLGFEADPILFAPIFIDFSPILNDPGAGGGEGGGEGEGGGKGKGGKGGKGGGDEIPLTGEIVESRLTIDILVEPGAPINDMEIILFVPIDNGGEFPIFPSHTFTTADFTLEGNRLFGTASTTDVNGLIFPPTPEFIPLWTLQIPTPDQGFTIYGEGLMRAEFDVIVPEPSALALLGMGSILLLRRRRRTHCLS
ncbi:MAG: PEP-CTERM sorting domain-containing protein [Phycisphaerales bacterium]|nr:PEP-CTERM sorting domain-containing protein [Phycisphaerales bacterium]